MQRTPTATKSVWLQGVAIPKFSGPRGKLHADVCVVGAGIAGLTTAYLLLHEGKSVIVLDERPIGGGQTGRTSAHLSSAIDDRFVEIEREHGVKGSRFAYESHAAAIDTIERISRDEKIACDFRRLDGWLSPIPTDRPDFLDAELAAAKRAGFADVEKVARGGIDHGPCLRFGGQARFQPLRYIVGLAGAIKGMGGRIYTGKRVTDVQGADLEKEKPAIVTLRGGDKVKANHVVVATNTPAPINDWFGIYTKQSAYQTYVIGAMVPRGAVPDGLYWDTADPYHYVRLYSRRGREEDVLLIGGEDHKTGQFPKTGGPFMNLEHWGREKFPMMGRVRYRWSGEVQEPADGVAFIGRALTKKENVYVATGDSGMGLTHGTIAGLLITDQIMGRKNAWEGFYDPSRKIINREFARENLNVLKQYKDLLTPGEVDSADDIAPGEGAILREGMSKLAVYRDPAGKIHRHSAICTHLQCVVQWNPVEKSWDCPCHGSRFDALGKVLMGPAIDDLPAAR
jgi:glycine/D-amino acid oxidase-like deaminating enzyme/nitrite reductase/ring-hydroxylating ferredoxin subunit